MSCRDCAVHDQGCLQDPQSASRGQSGRGASSATPQAWSSPEPWGRSDPWRFPWAAGHATDSGSQTTVPTAQQQLPAPWCLQNPFRLPWPVFE